MSSTAQRAFAGGELAPSLYARTDQAKYATGLRRARNCVVQRHGGIANRAGTEFVAATKDHGAVRLMKFVFSPDPDQVYVLEFGDGYIRVYQDGGQVVVDSADAWVAIIGAYEKGDLVTHNDVYYYALRDHTSSVLDEPGVGQRWGTYWYPLTGSIYEIPSPYAGEDVDAIQYVQSGDVVTLVHPDYPIYELSRTGHTAWRLDEATFGPRIAAPENLSIGGGSAGSAQWWAVTAVDAKGQESLPTVATANLVGSEATPVTLSWDPVPEAVGYNVYRSKDGHTYGQITLAGGTTSSLSDTTWDVAESQVVTTAQETWTSAGTHAEIEVLTNAIEDKSTSGDYAITMDMSVEITGGTPGAILEAVVYYSRNGETLVYATTISLTVPGAGGETPTGFTVHVPDNGYHTLEFRIVAQIYGNADPGTPTFTGTITGTGVFWEKGVSTIGDRGEEPDLDLSPPVPGVTFDAPGRYPSAVTYYQQRRVFAASSDEPEMVWASRTGDYSNFTTSMPLLDDDAVSWSLVGRQVNEVQHLVDLDRLRVFTTSGIHRINGDESGTLKPVAISPVQEVHHGASALPPIVISTAALYVQARGSVVRDFRPDAGEAQRNRDLTIYASHLFEGFAIVSWDFEETPGSRVWAVRSDGVLLCLTYLREHELWGWTWCDTDGAFEQVIVVPEGHEDRVYAVVRREVDGATVRYVERLVSRTITTETDPRDLIFMDSALSYDGTVPGVTVTITGGTTWTNGEQVTVTRSAAGWVSGDVGNEVHVYDEEGQEAFRIVIDEYVSATVVKGQPATTIPEAYRSTALTSWARAVETFAGLDHLEGKAVAVYADGGVVASPNNPEQYPDVLTVEGGQVVLPKPAAKVHIGLPYLTDIETLDIDTPSGPSLKTTKINVTKAHLYLEKSRGFWVGARRPADDDADPLDGLEEAELRDVDDDYDVIGLKTGTFSATIEGHWNTDGRLFIRQPDPIPLTILAVIPEGYF